MKSVIGLIAIFAMLVLSADAYAHTESESWGL